MPVLFLVFWLILNGRFTLEVLIIGILVSAVVSVFAYRIAGQSISSEKKIWAKIFPITTYLIGLIGEIIMANLQMIAIVLSSTIDIKPQIVYFDSPVRSDGAKVALANSITLTPGTITIKMDGDRFGIHAIDKSMADGIEDSSFVHKLRKIEGGHSRV